MYVAQIKQNPEGSAESDLLKTYTKYTHTLRSHMQTKIPTAYTKTQRLVAQWISSHDPIQSQRINRDPWIERDKERFCPRAKISNDSSPKDMQSMCTHTCMHTTHIHLLLLFSFPSHVLLMR